MMNSIKLHSSSNFIKIHVKQLLIVFTIKKNRSNKEAYAIKHYLANFTLGLKQKNTENKQVKRLLSKRKSDDLVNSSDTCVM